MNRQVQRACRQYDREWSAFNDVLYQLCRESMPSHGDASEVRAKVVIVGRAYATGIERHAPDGLKTVAFKIVDAIVGSRKWLDRSLAPLASRSSVPTVDVLQDIALLHRRLLDVVQTVMRDEHQPRSFVAKYLHFHAPVFPIYDSIASSRLYSRAVLPWPRSWSSAPPGGVPVDDEYWKFCVRISKFAETWRQSGLVEPTSRNLDTWLTYGLTNAHLW